MSRHIVIVGAGIIGASLAFHLSCRGAKVTVIDKGEAASGATSASWAWLNASHGNPKALFELRHLSMQEWRRMQLDLGKWLPIDWSGSVLWERPKEGLEAFVRQHASWGYDIRLVEEDELKHVQPFIKRRPKAVAFAPCEGALDPVQVTENLLELARRNQAQIRPNTAIEALICEGERVVGVRAANESILCDQVVLAAGIGSSALAGSVDVRLPQKPRAGIMAWLATPKTLFRRINVNAQLMVRQLNRKVVLAEEAPHYEGDGSDPETAGKRIQDLIAGQYEHGENLHLLRTQTGVRPIPQDGLPVLGRAPAVEGLYLAIMHSGVTLAAAAGRLATSELLDGTDLELLAPFRPARFAGNKLAA